MQEIKKLDVLSVALIVGALYAIMGFFMGLIFALIGGAFMASAASAGLPGAFGLFFGLAAIVFLPILYGVLGFIFGALTAFFYNILAPRIGGIKIELE